MAINKELVTEYDTSFGKVTLDAGYVRDYLVAGGGNVTNKEVELFLKLCQAQKLNPFTHEAYIIKYGNSNPASMVVGYDAYKRRAEENPNYLYKKSGIVTADKEGKIVHQEGTCMYPGQTLIGGWCEVYRNRNGKEVREYQEVSFEEYVLRGSDGNIKSTWKSKPCTMIVKCAVSQALRAAFPIEFNGLYTAEEMSNTAGEYISESDTGGVKKKTQREAKTKDGNVKEEVIEVNAEDSIITSEQRMEMFNKAKNGLGSDANTFIKNIINQLGYESTSSMTQKDYIVVINSINDEIAKRNKENIEDAQIINPQQKEVV